MRISPIGQPDAVFLSTGTDHQRLDRSGEAFEGAAISVRTIAQNDRLSIEVYAPNVDVSFICLRWQRSVGSDSVRVLGDAWERGYGDLEWRGIVPERSLPWYAIVHNTKTQKTEGFGICTGAGAMASWRVDETGLTLWLDVRNGGSGVMLGDRALVAAEVVYALSTDGDSPFQSAAQFCRHLCAKPRMPGHPVYGGNNWYYAYGHSSHQAILDDTARVVDLSPGGENRPYMTIDDGWQLRRTDRTACCGGPWIGNEKFPDMPGLVEQMRQRGARPGIWIRPLAAEPGTRESLLLPRARMKNSGGAVPCLDPSIPDVLDIVRRDARVLDQWGFDLVKHDFTTFDILGRWGFEMAVDLTNDGWRFADRSRTTAEIILDLYRAIRAGAGDRSIIIGCNTVSHLSAGIFELQRTGDDTSGRQWERTRKMGINTLAFRMPQHGAFYAVDADCVGLTPHVPWSMNAQWLDVLSRSGTPLFVSADPAALGSEQIIAMKRAFVIASSERPIAQPIDWLDTTAPRHWRIDGQTVSYDWTAGGLPLRMMP